MNPINIFRIVEFQPKKKVEISHGVNIKMGYVKLGFGWKNLFSQSKAEQRATQEEKDVITSFNYQKTTFLGGFSSQGEALVKCDQY